MNDSVACLREILHNPCLGQHILIMSGSFLFFTFMFFAIRITRKIYRKATPNKQTSDNRHLSQLFYPASIFVGLQFFIWNLRMDKHLGMDTLAKSIMLGMIIIFITAFIFDVFKTKAYLKYIAITVAACICSFVFKFKTDIIFFSNLINHIIWILWICAIVFSFIILRHDTFLYATCGFLSVTGFFAVSLCSYNMLICVLLAVWSGVFLGIGVIAKYREKKHKGLAISAAASLGFMVATLSILISYASGNHPLWSMAIPVLLMLPFFCNALCSLIHIKKDKPEDAVALQLKDSVLIVMIYLFNTLLSLYLRFLNTKASAIILVSVSVTICIATSFYYHKNKHPKTAL